ncbi:signal transducer and activator of transcription 5B-like [Sinocyclocheilus anshuiensis]|uniref:signal transducer and activator of transcription 5B-like n=1 Tax=Sinocyclocheilus anshuiensis TaxID=1608454 RepID=UPI0007B8EB04|nr:PREDICTED: signal transducer and activator of transcription 5B-like [Sinocyclocheilus anshuiensis]
MALWAQMTPQLQYLPTQTLNELYPDTFPLDVRHYLASWIEEQRWENFDVDNMEQKPQARRLLDQMVHLLQEVAQHNPNVVERVKLQHISRNLSVFQPQPMQLVRTVRDILRKERHILAQAGMHPNFPPFQQIPQGPPATNGTPQPAREDGKTDVDNLVLKVLEIQNCRQTLHQLQEDLNWEKQEMESIQGQNELDPQHSDQVARQTRIQQLEYNYSVCAKKRVQLLHEAVCALEQCQSCLILRIKSWRWEQHRATIGVHFDDNLGPLQTCENVGELINSTAILEHNTASKSTCATFRNMSIRKIKRADRKGSESVTEEKFALLFTTEITITGCESPYSIQAISLPVVVIVHGSQEINAMATIIWDCAFSEPNRIPFIVPERVPWKQMCEALSSKFMSEVQTQRCLDGYNLHFLAQKIFDQPDISEDFSNMPVSWAQFNKEVLPGRNFTFWQWFEGVMDLTKKCLRDYWSEGLIFGFIGKQHLHVILQNKPNGTFLLRFSDSEIGGITIAYVGPSDNGGRKIQNIQPFTKKDLDSAGLGDRIRDINCITHVHPDLPKNEVFKKFFTVPSPPNPDGYLPFKLTTVVNPGDQGSSTASIPPDTPMDIYGQSMSNVYGSNMNQGMFSPLPQSTPPYMPEQIPVQGPLYQSPMPQAPSSEEIDMEALEGILSSICQNTNKDLH